MHFSKGRGTVWRPITNHLSDSFNPFISISDQNKDFFFPTLRKEKNLKFMCNALFSVIDMQPPVLF